MNFAEFKKSNFLEKGKDWHVKSRVEQAYLQSINMRDPTIPLSTEELVQIRRTAEDSISRDRFLCMYDTTTLLPPNDENDIHKMYSMASYTTNIIHLKKVLRVPNILPADSRQEIARQWTEVTNCIKSLNRSDNQLESLFIPQEPGQLIPIHKHIIESKQIITFCYTFNDESNIISEKPNGCTTYKEDSKTIDKFITYPDQGKCYFEITNNKPHASYSDKWRFFWIYDLSSCQELPDTINDWKKIS